VLAIRGFPLRDRINAGRAEYALFAMGLALVAAWALVRFDGAAAAKAAVAEFLSHQTMQPSNGALTHSESVTRTEAYTESSSQQTRAPVAIFRIERIHLEVPVFDDINEPTLNRGVGRIPGTAHVGQIGNLGIAGHRDSFFRGLKDVRLGDTIALQRPTQTDKYVVNKIQIVRPEETYVLDPTDTPTLTLVTCFPFTFVGHAPKRYIVLASIQNSSRAGSKYAQDLGFLEQEHQQ
jgi:sortase A